MVLAVRIVLWVIVAASAVALVVIGILGMIAKG